MFLKRKLSAITWSAKKSYFSGWWSWNGQTTGQTTSQNESICRSLWRKGSTEQKYQQEATKWKTAKRVGGMIERFVVGNSSSLCTMMRPSKWTKRDTGFATEVPLNSNWFWVVSNDRCLPFYLNMNNLNSLIIRSPRNHTPISQW